MRAGLVVLLFGVGCTGAKSPPGMTGPVTFDKGVSTGSPVTMMIGAAGGTLKSADGRIALSIPAGALTADTAVSIEPITNTAPLGVGGAYRLGPEGTKFAMPATVTFTFVAAMDTQGASTDALGIGYQDPSGSWHAFTDATVDLSASTVAVQTSHLSDWSMLLGWQVTPGEADVATNGSVALKLRYCAPEKADGPDGELSGLLSKCEAEDDLPALVTVSGWSVNGTLGGSATDGTVDGSGKTAMYTAPSAAPQANPVAVSVQFGTGKGNALAVSNVNVAGNGWHGTVSWTLNGTTMTSDANYMKTWKNSGSGMATLVSGTADGYFDFKDATAEYQYDYLEDYTNNYGAAGCTHMVTQTRHELLSGTATDVTALTAYLVPDGTGASYQFILATITGDTNGHVQVMATEAVTGAGCTQIAPTSTDTPETGRFPADSIQFTIVSTSTTSLSGTGTVHFDGMPPRDYTVMYSFQH